MSIVDDLLQPYRTYVNTKKVFKDLRKRNTIDRNKMESEIRALQVDRDMNKLIAKYLDTGVAYSITVSFVEEDLKRVICYLERQQLDFVVISDNKIKIRS